MKNSQIRVRVTGQEREVIRSVAASQNMTISDLVRSLAINGGSVQNVKKD
jgi:uncharacterized protein (DUF1778 family)